MTGDRLIVINWGYKGRKRGFLIGEGVIWAINRGHSVSAMLEIVLLGLGLYS